MAELPGDARNVKTAKHKAMYGRKALRKTVSKLSAPQKIAAVLACPNPPSPSRPNGGEIIVCSANEQVAIKSAPRLPTAGQPCYFHCGLLWTAPSGWTLIYDPPGANQQGNPLYGGFGISPTMALKAPGSISSGNIGTVTVLAEYSQCDAPYNTSSSSIIWSGATAVSNGKVNGSSSGSGTVYVPGGYANLSVDLTGGSDGGSTSWYITNGSGSLSPSYNYCAASWSGFIRVVVNASNRCGTGGSWTFYLTSQSGYRGYQIAPNPAKDKLSILLDYLHMIGELIQNVALYDAENKAWFSADANQLKNEVGDKNVIDIATKNFPRGTYFLHVTYGGNGGKDEIFKSQVVLE